VIEKILNQFDIKAAAIQQLKDDEVWIVDEKYILKQSSAVNITNSAELAEKLLAAGIPVAAYMKTKTTAMFAKQTTSHIA
jgi:rRNA-processing protein FCF1